MQDSYTKSPYFHVAFARDLKGGDRVLYRALEMLPGLLTWATLIAIVVCSFLYPIWTAYFIIAFDFYWLLKTLNLSIHHWHNWRRMNHNIKVDWTDRLKDFKYEHLYHVVILPFYKEGLEILEGTLDSLKNTKYPKERLVIVLASEERAGDEPYNNALIAKEKYNDVFGHILITRHPADLPGEMPGKGSNISYAAEQVRLEILDKENIPYENAIVSAFDVDTTTYDQYFLCLTWHFLTTENPYRASYQPVPLYNNNIWEINPVSRVAALSSTYWQMIQQERPEKLATFSSHAINFKTLYEGGYWQKNMVSEDSRIFFNMLLAYDGDYRVIPISYPVSMDANFAPTFWQTMINIYKQHRRWTWGVESVPYILFNFIKHKKIPLAKKLDIAFTQVEGFWSLATNPIIILVLGWLPLALGGAEFRNTVLSYNLPLMTSNLLTITMFGLLLSALIGVTLMPKMPKEYTRRKLRSISTVLQWVFVPFTIIIFSAIPGIETQTRLMFGKYMGFWVTPKTRAK